MLKKCFAFAVAAFMAFAAMAMPDNQTVVSSVVMSSASMSGTVSYSRMVYANGVLEESVCTWSSDGVEHSCDSAQRKLTAAELSALMASAPSPLSKSVPSLGTTLPNESSTNKSSSGSLGAALISYNKAVGQSGSAGKSGSHRYPVSHAVANMTGSAHKSAKSINESVASVGISGSGSSSYFDSCGNAVGKKATP